ncbi:Pentatricopeptide repeat-containing protein At2g31400 [Durusdinium trenchii]|uniref:Chloroplastic n=1 Tax=Durusdinium trenchii TaxID=1381693 RepID=A0ABP0RSB6_9DINO
MLLNCCWRLVNVATLNAAVSACERVAAWPQALCYADPSGLVLPDIITYNTALSACGNGGKLQQVVNLMAKMRRVVRLDAITYTAAISTCEKRLHWQGSVGFLDEMRDAHLRANVITYNAVMATCGPAWEASLVVLRQSPSKDLVSYNTALSSCEKGEQWLRAFSLFSTVAPSVITYNGCLSATAKVQLWRAALDLLQLNPRPSLISFNTVMSATERGRQWHMVADLYMQLSQQQLQPDAFAHAAFAAHTPWRRALAALARAALGQHRQQSLVAFLELVQSCEQSTSSSYIFPALMAELSRLALRHSRRSPPLTETTG